MKCLKIIILIFVLFFSTCSKYKRTKSTFHTVFSLPINTEGNSIKIFKSSEFFSEIPSVYKIIDADLYIIDKFNNRMLQFNKNQKLVLFITNSQKRPITLVYIGSNHILQPLYISKRLFGFNELGNLWVSKENIYLESILIMKDEEQKVNSRSLILKYNKNGTPEDIIGNRVKKSNKIFPFANLEKFSIDEHDNIFIYLKTEEDWWVRKLNKNHKTIYRFSSFDFFQKNNIIPDTKKKEKIIIENIDNFWNGDFLVVALTYFKNEIEFQKTIFYKIDLETGNAIKLFNINNENYNFILIDNSNFLYIWETEEGRKNIEYITLRLYNLEGNTVSNYTMKLDRNETPWYEIKLQKDGKVTGINIEDNKFNVVVWK